MVKKKRARKSKVPKPTRKSSKTKYKKKNTTWVFVFLGVMVLFAVLFNVSQMNITGNVAMTGSVAAVGETGKWFDLVGTDALRYLFGDPISPNMTNGSLISAVIVTIAIWLFIFFTFADIISVFGTFSKWVAWVIGFLIAVVMANIGLVVKITTVITGVFAGLGVAAVYVGLGCAFAAFLAINIGLGRFKGWALKRQAGIKAFKAEAGGIRLAGGIKALGKVTKGFEYEGA